MIPDPLEFVGRALVARGALVEAPMPDGLEAILPDDLARDEGIGDAVVLVARADPTRPGAIACGIGTAMLERHVARAREQCPRGDLRVRGGVRAGHARSLAERFVVRNGKVEIRDVGPSSGIYALATVAWTVEADDRFEGLVDLAFDPVSGALVDPQFVSFVADMGEPDIPVALSPGLVEAAAGMIARRIPARLDAVIAPIAAQIERRAARDHARIVGYYEALAVEAAGARRRLEAAALAARIAQFARERDGKLAELGGRYTLRIAARLATMRWVDTDRARVAVRMVRRKSHRDLDLHLPPGAHQLDRLTCEGCDCSTAAPALCDEHLHVLCEACAPVAQGRLRCPACGALG